MKKKYIIALFACYVGTDETVLVIANSLQEAEEYADGLLDEHRNQYDYLVNNDFENEMIENYGDDWEDEVDADEAFYDSEAYNYYRENCYYNVEEATPQEIEDYEGYNWIDITKGD